MFTYERKEFEFVINGKDASRNNLLFDGQRCLNDECPEVEVIDGFVIEKEKRYWDNPDIWQDKKVPEEGADVVIEA
jgi:hypothetical protein